MLLINYYEQSDLDALMSKYCIGTKHRLGGKIQRSVDRMKRFGRSERGGGGRGKIVRARMLRCVMKKAHIIQL